MYLIQKPDLIKLSSDTNLKICISYMYYEMKAYNLIKISFIYNSISKPLYRITYIL